MSTATPTIERGTMSETDLELRSEVQADAPWQAVVWDDPVNLMTYVTHVFRTYFGYTRAHAHELMLAVHEQGSAVVAAGARETMEAHVRAMHEFGLWATVRRGDE